VLNPRTRAAWRRNRAPSQSPARTVLVRVYGPISVSIASQDGGGGAYQLAGVFTLGTGTATIVKFGFRVSLNLVPHAGRHTAREDDETVDTVPEPGQGMLAGDARRPRKRSECALGLHIGHDLGHNVFKVEGAMHWLTSGQGGRGRRFGGLRLASHYQWCQHPSLRSVRVWRRCSLAAQRGSCDGHLGVAGVRD
jgi:hypothetical protein